MGHEPGYIETAGGEGEPEFIMQWLRLIIFLLAPMLLALAASALVMWAWANDLPLLPALLVGLVFLSLALSIHLLGQMVPNHDDDLHFLWREVEHLRAMIQLPQEGEEEVSSPRAAREQTAQEQTAPQGSTEPSRPSPASRALSSTASAAPSAPGRPEQARFAHHPAPRAHGAPSSVSAIARELRLYMEPVVSLENNATVFYRALPALPAEGEALYLGGQAFLRARQQGHSGAFAQHLLARCVAFAGQLKARGLSETVICPLDMAVLRSADVADALISQLLDDNAAHAPLMLALRHGDLAHAPQEARMHLLTLAQASGGVVLEMDAPDINGFFLPVPLPVRYLDIPAAHLAETTAMRPFLQRLGTRGWTLMASGIDSLELLARARACATLGRGRQISPPRRVRDPGEMSTTGRHPPENPASHQQQLATG